MKQPHKTFIMWLIIFMMMLFVWQMAHRDQVSVQRIDYPSFVRAVEEKRVAEVVLKGNREITGRFKEGDGLEQTAESPEVANRSESGAQSGPERKYRNRFRTVGPTNEQTFKILRENDITPIYQDEEKQTLLTSLLINWGPMIVLILLFYFFLRQIQMGGGKAMSFGKSKAKMLSSNDKKVTFSDVSGVEEAKEELKEVVDFLKDPKKYTKLGGKIPKGVILIGPPGTGKTLLARAVAGEADVPFFSISGSDFVEMFVGVGASRVRDLFEQGKKNAPCIIFIDEIDAVGRHRGAGLGGGHDEREQTLNQLLVEMDGFEFNEGVILIAATNRIDVLDPALLRPGRFDRRVNVSSPDLRGRLGILKVHARKTPLDESVDLEVVAKGTPGFTGADLANLVNEAALNAARLNKKKLESGDFEAAKDKVLMGPERKSMVISDEEKRVTAFHEAGHTLVGLNLPQTDPIHKVSIMPRGGALGVTQTLPNEDRLNLTSEKAKNLIAFLMGGRCAEELVFGEITSGASNDIERATQLARKMVCTWGMSDKLGPINYHKEPLSPWSPPQQDGGYSEQTGQEIDGEIHRLVDNNYKTAMQILKDNRDALNRLAEGLMIWETLDSKQVGDLVAGRDIGTPLIEEVESKENPLGKKKEEDKTDVEGVASPGDDPLPA